MGASWISSRGKDTSARSFSADSPVSLFSCVVGHFRGCVYVALLSAGSTDSCFRWLPDLSRGTTLTASHGACLCPPEGASDECARYPGRVYLTFGFADCDRDCHISARLALSGFLIVLGAHYLSFVFMYSMWQFAGLCTVLAASGVALGQDPSASVPSVSS